MDDLVRDATRLVERGFDAVKVKLGRPDPRDDIWEEPIVVVDGHYPLPQKPGVGLQLRSDVVAATRIGCAATDPPG